ncbi:hypothetical protein J2Z53_001329 [Clostridium moniliforme]|uniref:Uncharacterized protein n=1 Tax=Clostridium moniliforme TaxID=39489 RepID=A0ABS4F0H3_9CLOT|nr:hypothetical protein [Clostridium moniliforme]MBP1889746.1 hypothetical protein [Clostridium moniliforme]
MNKNFIPEKFNLKKEYNKNKSINRGIILLLVANILIFPVNINSLNKKYFENNNTKKEISTQKNIDLKDKLINWINLLHKYTNYGDIEDNSGKIVLKNIKDIKKIEKDLTIKKVFNENKKYYLNVLGD